MKIARSERGYTLIEIMIVIAIIGILAAILLPNVIRARYQAQLSVCEQNERGLASALILYSSDNSYAFPSSISALVPNYAEGIPFCPTSSATGYSYTAASSPANYTISCTGSHVELLGPSAGPAGSPHIPEYNAWGGFILR